VRLRAVLQPPAEPAAPGALDFARQAYFQRLGAVGYVFGRAEVLAPADHQLPFGLWLHRLREAMAARILEALPGESGAVAAALMTGVRGAIPEEVMATMHDSGLAHLLAISGLHMGLVVGLLFFALRAGMALVPGLALRRPIKKWVAVGAILGALGYLLLTGATVPTQPAFVMVSLVLVAVMLDRRGLSLRLVAWAAVFVLAAAPESLLSASFQMSFAAVIALITGYEVTAERGLAALGERRLAVRVVAYLAGVAVTSLIAGLATAPFALYHFNRIAWYGLLANLVAVPLTAFWIMPWALVAFALMPFGAEALALAPMGWGIDLLLAVARDVAALPSAVSLVPATPRPPAWSSSRSAGSGFACGAAPGGSAVCCRSPWGWPASSCCDRPTCWRRATADCSVCTGHRADCSCRRHGPSASRPRSGSAASVRTDRGPGPIYGQLGRGPVVRPVRLSLPGQGTKRRPGARRPGAHRRLRPGRGGDQHRTDPAAGELRRATTGARPLRSVAIRQPCRVAFTGGRAGRERRRTSWPAPLGAPARS